MHFLKIILAMYNLFLYNSNMGNKALKIITGILVVIWMICVFQFSNEQSTETKNTSVEFTQKIVELVAKIIDISEIKKEELVENLNPYIRKFAHYSLYTIGGILIIMNVRQYKNLSSKKQIIISLIIGVLYSISDEIHQYFIPGRSCQIKDIYIDSLGIATGIVFVILIIKLYQILSTIKIGVSTNEYNR